MICDICGKKVNLTIKDRCSNCSYAYAIGYNAGYAKGSRRLLKSSVKGENDDL